MESTASTFVQKKRSSVEYESHDISDGSAWDIIDGFEINSFESVEELNCFSKKHPRELDPRYNPAAIKEGSIRFKDSTIQLIKIEPSLSDEWMEIEEQRVDDDSVIFEEIIGWPSSFDRLDVDLNFGMTTEEMEENLSVHEVEPQILLANRSYLDEAESSPQSPSSHISGAGFRGETSGLLTSLPMSLDSLAVPPKQEDEYMALSTDDDKTPLAIYDDPELSPPATVQAAFNNTLLPLSKAVNRAEASHSTLSGLSRTRFTPVMQQMLITVNGRQILIPVINISASNSDIRGILLSTRATKVMDQSRSAEALSNAVAPSEHTSLSTADTLSDSTTLATPTTQASIYGPLPSCTQSPTVSSTTTPPISTLDGGNSYLSSSSPDVVADTASKTSKLNKNNIAGEMKRFPCQYCDKAFTRRYNKTIHERAVHSGEKPYCCDICLRNFSRLSVLKTHKKKKHSEDQPFKCDVESKVRQLNNNGNIPTSGGEDDSRDETDKSGDTLEIIPQKSLDILSQGKGVLEEKTDIKDWMRRYALRDCYVKLHNFVNNLPDEAFL